MIFSDLYKNTVVEKPKIILLILVVFLLSFGYFSKNFQLDASSDTLLLENDPDLNYLREVNKKYKSKEFLVLTYTHSPNEDYNFKSENTIKNSYDITLKNEDYTLGKVLEFILHEEHYKNDVLTFCGFKKFHPHDDDSIIRIAFTENQDMMFIYDTLISVCSLASDVYSKIKTNFQEEAI